MGSPQTSSKRQRGEIETLPSDALRVRVYAGVDPVTGKRYYLTELIPPGPRATKEAKNARTRLLSSLDEQRNARTRATPNELMDRHLELLDESTLDSYESFVRIQALLVAADFVLASAAEYRKVDV